MNSNKSKFHLLELPADVTFSDEAQEIIFLIREELKSAKVLSALMNIGLEDSIYKADLASLIYKKLGIAGDVDETMYQIWLILEKYSDQVEYTHKSITQQAINAYHALIDFKEETLGKTVEFS